MEENQNIEWKENWRDEYLKWVCGFANAQGGKIYIGAKVDGTIYVMLVKILGKNCRNILFTGKTSW